MNDSRKDIYDYLYFLFYDVVTKNVYSINAPQELTESDVKDGFIVLYIGDFVDQSEFVRQTYGMARCYVVAYIPPISRGRLDYAKYETFENNINTVIQQAAQSRTGTYHIQEDSVLSSDGDETSNANNTFFTFIKSFIVTID